MCLSYLFSSFLLPLFLDFFPLNIMYSSKSFIFTVYFIHSHITRSFYSELTLVFSLLSLTCLPVTIEALYFMLRSNSSLSLSLSALFALGNPLPYDQICHTSDKVKGYFSKSLDFIVNIYHFSSCLKKVICQPSSFFTCSCLSHTYKTFKSSF